MNHAQVDFLIALNLLKAFLPKTMAIPVILMSWGLNDTPTTLTTKTFQNVLTMFAPPVPWLWRLFPHGFQS